MKWVLHLSLLGLLIAGSEAAQLARRDGQSKVAANEDRTITKVVKMLQDMMTKSQADGQNERTLFGTLKCYCDDNEAEKKASIRKLTEQIEMLDSSIAGLQAENGKLSKEVAGLQASMEATQAAMDEATTLRNEANAAYNALVTDLTQAISQMTEAIDVLAAVGADQTLQSARDHEKFMAGYGKEPSLLKLKSRIQDAMTAAKAFLPADKQALADSFLQAPFTGNYAAQSGEIVGILKNMRDTFNSNLASAHAKEEAELAAYTDFMTAKTEEMNIMQKSYDKKQGELAANDAELTAQKEQRKSAKESKASDEAFLAELLPMCAEKAKQYQERLALRTQEEAAIAEAIAILNSDAAFTTFGKVDATSTGETLPEFLQTGSKRRSISGKRLEVEKFLRRAVKGSKHLDKAMQLLKEGNPFDIVLAEMEKMLDLIEKEQESDEQKRDWCKAERKRTKADIDTKDSEILGLKSEIKDLEDTIHLPVTGLLDMIEADETKLENNVASQKEETEIRTKENKDYQEDIAHLVESQDLIKRAIVVLEAYYKKVLGELEGPSFVQESPEPPSTWEGKYAGQSTAGNTVINMLTFILSEAAKEEKMAHTEEETSQKSYEDSMTSLKAEEASLEENLSQLRETLAETKKTLLEKQDDLTATKEARDALKQYLRDIKPGCDFIIGNFRSRKQFRKDETSALEGAIALIKGSPVYKNAVEDARVKDLGKCKDICLGREEHVECKACLADVTVPGYCAGHRDTEGCEGIEPLVRGEPLE